jgi:hypothetical protein
MATKPTAWKVGLNEAELRAAYWPVLRTLLLILGTVASVCFLDRFYVLVAISLIWAPYVFFHPREGLWITPGFILLASVTSLPEAMGLEGAGYSPELPYWAVGVCVLFVAMLLRYIQQRRTSDTRLDDANTLRPPRGFYAFAAMSVIAGAVGIVHGFAVQNVAKQFFGCILLCAYFLFALRFAPKKEHIQEVISRLVSACVACSLLYLAVIYFPRGMGFHKELTPISVYAGGLFVLLIPRVLYEKTRFQMDRAFLAALFLFTFPIMMQFKRAVVACVICGFLGWGLRSASRRKSYVYLMVAFLVFVLALSTSFLNPVSAWLLKQTGWEGMFSEDVQSHYSVFLRVEEFRQVIDSLGTVPVLGTGLGSTITWSDPRSNLSFEQETLDIGWLYLLAKMGIAGTAAFIWFVAPIGVASLRKRINGLHLALFLLLIFHLVQMIADASFVYFMTAGWEGTACAFLYIMNKSESEGPGLIPHTV